MMGLHFFWIAFCKNFNFLKLGESMSAWSRCFIVIIVCFFSCVMPSRLCAEVDGKGPFLIISNPNDAGMFAVFATVIGAIHFYEQGNFAGLKVDLNSGRYLDPEIGLNWWEYFFEPIVLGDESYQPKYYFSGQDVMNLFFHAYPHQDRFKANRFLQKYVHIKPHLQEEIDAFVRTHFDNHFVIGIHHRGTDKVTESPIVPYQKTYQVLLHAIEKLSKAQRGNLRIYVATDDDHFLTFLRSRFPANTLIYNDFSRSADGTPLHAYGTNFYSSNYQMGKEALFDCLLLSRCHMLLRPASSCLSLISMAFNPYIPVLNLTSQ